MTHRCTSGMLGGQADHGVLYCLLYHKHKNLRASIPHCKKKEGNSIARKAAGVPFPAVREDGLLQWRPEAREGGGGWLAYGARVPASRQSVSCYLLVSPLIPSPSL